MRQPHRLCGLPHLAGKIAGGPRGGKSEPPAGDKGSLEVTPVPVTPEDLPVLRAARPLPAPLWALFQRHLRAAMSEAALWFVDRHTEAAGTLRWWRKLPGMDGFDDGSESFDNFPLLFAQGGDARVLAVAHRNWDAVTWQFTQCGHVWREFDAYYDWMHHGEMSQILYHLGLADPTPLRERQRAVRFADLYSGDDPLAPNYDRERRLMRLAIAGSRGRRLQMTAEDCSTHRAVLDNYCRPSRTSRAWKPLPVDRRCLRGDSPPDERADGAARCAAQPRGVRAGDPRLPHIRGRTATAASSWTTWGPDGAGRRQRGPDPDKVCPSGRIGCSWRAPPSLSAAHCCRPGGIPASIWCAASLTSSGRRGGARRGRAAPAAESAHQCRLGGRPADGRLAPGAGVERHARGWGPRAWCAPAQVKPQAWDWVKDHMEKGGQRPTLPWNRSAMGALPDYPEATPRYGTCTNGRR